MERRWCPFILDYHQQSRVPLPYFQAYCYETDKHGHHPGQQHVMNNHIHFQTSAELFCLLVISILWYLCLVSRVPYLEYPSAKRLIAQIPPTMHQSHIPQCIICNRNLQMYEHCSYILVCCGIFVQCVVRFVRWVYFKILRPPTTMRHRYDTVNYLRDIHCIGSTAHP